MNKLNIKTIIFLSILFQLNKISPVHLALYKLKEIIFKNKKNIGREEIKNPQKENVKNLLFQFNEREEEIEKLKK